MTAPLKRGRTAFTMRAWPASSRLRAAASPASASTTRTAPPRIPASSRARRGSRSASVRPEIARWPARCRAMTPPTAPTPRSATFTGTRSRLLLEDDEGDVVLVGAAGAVRLHRLGDRADDLGRRLRPLAGHELRETLLA